HVTGVQTCALPISLMDFNGFNDVDAAFSMVCSSRFLSLSITLRRAFTSRKIRNSRTTNIDRYDTEKLIIAVTILAFVFTLSKSERNSVVMTAIQIASKSVNPREL